jgi:predicted DNA-binding transcriptional regulator
MFLLKNARTLLEMADSKLEFRVLRLYACFAQARRPLRLTELVQLLHIPKSSCFALVKGLVTDGYLYEIAPSVGYYPTARMHEHTNAIADEDPVLSSIHSILESLRDTTGETVVVGRVNGNQSVFVAVYEQHSAFGHGRREKAAALQCHGKTVSGKHGSGDPGAGAWQGSPAKADIPYRSITLPIADRNRIDEIAGVVQRRRRKH